MGAEFSADTVSSLPVAPLLVSFVGGTRRDHTPIHLGQPSVCFPDYAEAHVYYAWDLCPQC